MIWWTFRGWGCLIWRDQGRLGGGVGAQVEMCVGEVEGGGGRGGAMEKWGGGRSGGGQVLGQGRQEFDGPTSKEP